MKNLTVKTSNRLVHLFCAFSNPIFLLADDGHPRLVFFMLEALNGILFHQLANNPNVIYAILRSHLQFEELGTFTLAKGLEEVRRVQQLKEEHDAKRHSGSTAANPKSPTTNASREKVGLLHGQAGGRGDPEEIFDADHESVSTPSLGLTGLTLEGAALRSPTPGSAGTPESPRTDAPQLDSAQLAAGLSEKARGKMRERESLSDDVGPGVARLDPELERIAAAGVGRNGFVPTQEWVRLFLSFFSCGHFLLSFRRLCIRDSV